MNILHLDSSPLGDYSASRKLSRQVVEKLQREHTDAKVVYRDLSAEPLPFVTAPWVLAAFGQPGGDTDEAKVAIAVSDKLVDELLAADVIVAGVPMYNWSVPASFKAWIDQIVRLNRTFTDDYKGLAGGRRAIFAIAAGGNYEVGSPMGARNHEDPYLRDIFGFIGITDVQFVHFWNTIGEERDEGERKAQQELAQLAA